MYILQSACSPVYKSTWLHKACHLLSKTTQRSGNHCSVKPEKLLYIHTRKNMYVKVMIHNFDYDSSVDWLTDWALSQTQQQVACAKLSSCSLDMPFTNRCSKIAFLKHPLFSLVSLHKDIIDLSTKFSFREYG